MTSVNPRTPHSYLCQVDACAPNSHACRGAVSMTLEEFPSEPSSAMIQDVTELKAE